jgi:hypothetical protein
MVLYVGNYGKYNIYVSDKPNKKYYSIVNNKKVYFGDSSYEHYFDKMGYYKNLNHNDNKRRTNYYSRHGKQAKEGTAKWFAHNILW